VRNGARDFAHAVGRAKRRCTPYKLAPAAGFEPAFTG
jgi:hypothetical protein